MLKGFRTVFDRRLQDMCPEMWPKKVPICQHFVTTSK